MPLNPSSPARRFTVARACGLVASAISAGLLSGCASYFPGPGETVTAEVVRPLTVRELDGRRDVAAARPALKAAGIGEAEIAAGRVVRVHCAVMTDGWWDSLAVLPEGFGPLDDRVLTLQVLDRGDNDRLPVNRVVAKSPLGPGGLAYRAIPNWRERGLRDNFERKDPEGGPRSSYLVVQGSWLVRCRP